MFQKEQNVWTLIAFSLIFASIFVVRYFGIERHHFFLTWKGPFFDDGLYNLLRQIWWFTSIMTALVTAFVPLLTACLANSPVFLGQCLDELISTLWRCKWRSVPFACAYASCHPSKYSSEPSRLSFLLCRWYSVLLPMFIVWEMNLNWCDIVIWILKFEC